MTDQLWLERLFEAHHASIHAFAVRRVGPDTADDVVAEVFAIAWRRRDEVPDPPTTWLYRVARNVIGHEYRSRGRRRELAAALRNRRECDDQPHTAVEVDAILAQLNPLDAELLRLTVWEQLTPAEVAEVLQISPGAARTRLMRARHRAQRVYERTVAEDAPARLSPHPAH